MSETIIVIFKCFDVFHFQLLFQIAPKVIVLHKMKYIFKKVKSFRVLKYNTRVLLNRANKINT